MIDITMAIHALDPNAEVFINGRGEITWHCGNPNGITAEQIIEKQAALAIQAEADAAAEASRLVSVKEKLEGLGLTTEEVKTAFGI